MMADARAIRTGNMQWTMLLIEGGAAAHKWDELILILVLRSANIDVFDEVKSG